MSQSQVQGSLRRRFDFWVRQLTPAELAVMDACSAELLGLTLETIRTLTEAECCHGRQAQAG